MGGHRQPGPTGGGAHQAPPASHGKKKHRPSQSNPQRTSPQPAGSAPPKAGPKAVGAPQVKRVVVVYDPNNSQGEIYAVGLDGSIKVHGNVVVGGKDSPTPPGTYHASHWESNHVSTKYGGYANTPWDKSPLGLNAFGPYQLHLKELEKRGIYLHGTMGPSWNPFTALNSLLSPTSHGCVRMSNKDDIALHDLMPSPDGIEVKISTDKADIPKGKDQP